MSEEDRLTVIIAFGPPSNMKKISTFVFHIVSYLPSGYLRPHFSPEKLG